MAALGGALVGMVEDSFGAFIGGVIAILFWLLGTVLIWRETTAERRESKCGRKRCCTALGAWEQREL